MTDHKTPKEKDQLTGVETTGHEWDGLKELNKPAPRWWLLVFLVTVIWAVGYWFFYPAWPTLSGNTKGSLGWTSHTKLDADQAEIAARQVKYLERLQGASFDTVMNDPELYTFSVAGGKAAFKENCAQCHGTGGAGGKGYPNLNDDDWLWGGTVDDLYTTIRYGIRSTHPDTRISQMPAFGKDGILKPEEISQAADYVLSLSGGEQSESAQKGAEIFVNNCAVCHGEDGKGMRIMGAPNLTDKIWLYGGDKATLVETISKSRAGVMPTWLARLDDLTIRQLAIYVHSLGGGEAMPAPVPADVSAPTEQ